MADKVIDPDYIRQENQSSCKLIITIQIDHVN